MNDHNKIWLQMRKTKIDASWNNGQCKWKLITEKR